jgi:SAM-dependent methyltransferase
MSQESSWGERFGKARDHVRRGDLSRLVVDIAQFWAWMRAGRPLPGATPHANCDAEDLFWDLCDVASMRKRSWSNAGDFGTWIFQDRLAGRWSGVIDLLLDFMQISPTQSLCGLVLGCGDMIGEYSMFTHPKLKFAKVDAYDVSRESIERARRLTDEKGLKVNYYVADINQIELPVDRYALVVIFHSFHHFKQIDHVTNQINQALLPGGVFFVHDYVGPCRLQFTERQLFYAQLMLEALPIRYRREPDGAVKQRVQGVSLEDMSPDEAICSDQILPALARYMHIAWQHNWAGLLHPLLDGIGFNFSASSEDQAIVRFLYELDKVLCQTGEVEPNFTITIATKR